MKLRLRTGILAALALLLLILDTKTAISGAREGIRLCVMTVIPSLFPFFLLSSLLTSALAGTKTKLLAPICRLLRIPKGSESIILVGVLGGYPMGAQAVTQAYTSGVLKKEDARRMLGFCSQAGPAFLFGIIGAAFYDSRLVWILWGIHLFSALLVGLILPGGSVNSATLRSGKVLTLPEALEKSITALIRVCGWIVLFRIVLAFANRWFLWLLHPQMQIAINGLAELTIGCTSLSYIPKEGLRFVICAGMLGFGGLCVTLQTMSVTEPLGLGMYLPGKLLQGMFSVILAMAAQYFLFSADDRVKLTPALYAIPIILAIGILLLRQKREKNSSNFPLVRV